MGELIKGYGYKFANVTASATTTLVTGPGFLGSVMVNSTGAGAAETITIYDNTTSATTIIGTIAAPTQGQRYVYNCMFNVGLTVKNVSTTSNLTITYGPR